MNWTHLATCFAAAFAVSWVATACLIRLAPKMGLIDEPSDRKVHSRPTPKGGGLAIWLAINVACLAVLPCFGWLASVILLAPVLWALLFIVLLGLADDVIGLPWHVRLFIQTTIAALLLWYWPSSIADHWLLFVLAVLWLVGMTNAFNMLDNMDGLSGGVAWIAAAFLLIVEGVPLRSASEMDIMPDASALMLISLIGGLTGFLWFNRPPARIFMGDCGSTHLGILLGFMGLRFALRTPHLESALAAILCIFAVPVYDMTTVVILRLSQGRSPFHADKQHLSHRLVDRGLSNTRAVLVIHRLALASGASGLLVYHARDMPFALGLAGLVLSGWLLLAMFEFFHRRTRLRERREFSER